MLRVIQLYNANAYGCKTGTEDGYAPAAADHSCPPHDSDYRIQDWRISLTEFLRLVQYYNVGGYHPCEDGEDGYCPGAVPGGF